MTGRGFEEVTKRRTRGILTLPLRKTIHSAGYDFFTPRDYDGLILGSGEETIIWTDVKAYMHEGEYLAMHIRSSLAIKHGLMLVNCTGIIDSDYYDNESNEGNIGLCIQNNSCEDYIFKYNDCVAQGIFSHYLTIDEDKTIAKRIGGIGSTTKKGE